MPEEFFDWFPRDELQQWSTLAVSRKLGSSPGSQPLCLHSYHIVICVQLFESTGISVPLDAPGRNFLHLYFQF